MFMNHITPLRRRTNFTIVGGIFMVIKSSQKYKYPNKNSITVLLNENSSRQNLMRCFLNQYSS